MHKITLLIWGCNEFSAQLCRLVEANHHTVIAFIDNHGANFCQKPVLTPQVFKQKTEWAHLPIVIAIPHFNVSGTPVIDFEITYQFKLKLQEISYKYQIKNQLLHPAALTDFMVLDYPDKVIPFGLPGSGIVLFNQICSTLLARKPKLFQRKSEAAKFFEKMCYEYTSLIHQTIPDIFYAQQGFDFHMSAWQVGSSYAICQLQDQQLHVYAFPTRNHIASSVYNYHYLPSSDYLSRLQQQQYKLFFNMRNPLDVILSCINKNGGINKETRDIDIALFCTMSKLIIGYLNAWYPLPDYLTHFSYDELIQRPIITIKNLMKQLNIRASTRKAAALWQQFAFKQLSTAPQNHFWAGGVNKWQDFFKPEHLSLLKYFGIEEVLEKYHYHSTLALLTARTQHILKDNWRSHYPESFHAAVDAPPFIFHGENQAELPNFLSSVYGENHYVKSNNIYLASPCTELLHKAKLYFENPFIQQLVSAGRILLK